MMTMLFSFALLFSIVFTTSHAFEVQVDSNGESDQESLAMTVSLTNGYEHDIKFYYVNSKDNSEIYMDTLVPGDEYTMNSFTGHSFAVKKSDDTPLSTVSF